jgi:ankyrin repeat protein
LLQFLLNGDFGLDINQTTEDGKTPLWYASNACWTNGIEMLLSEGADVNIGDTATRWTPLHLTGNKGLYGIVYMLLQHRADPKKTGVKGETAELLALT